MPTLPLKINSDWQMVRSRLIFLIVAVIADGFAPLIANAYVNIDPQPMLAVGVLDSLIALDCPGTTSLQLLDVYQWRKSGDLVAQTSLDEIRSIGNRVSWASELVFADNGTSDIKGVKIGGGSISQGKTPATLDGCNVQRLMVNGTVFGSPDRYLVDSSVWNRLTSVDQYVARLLMRGWRAEPVRALINQKTIQLPLSQRVSILKSSSISVLNHKGFELYLDKEFLLNGDAIVRGMDLKSSSEYYKTVYFHPNGKPLAIDHPDFLLPENWTEASIRAGMDGTNRCEAGWGLYREDGSLEYCNQIYHAKAIGQANPENIKVEGVAFFNSWRSRFSTPTTFKVLISDRRQESVSSEQRVFRFMTSPNLVIGTVGFVAGDSACEGFPAEISPPTDNNDYGKLLSTQTIRIPPNCNGVYQIELLQAPAKSKR